MKQFGRQRQTKRVLPRGYSEEESSTVIVGQSAPSLEDVLSGRSQVAPFDLPSFMVFAERRLFSEAVTFLTEVDGLRSEKNFHLFQRKLRHIVSEFVSEEGCRQVNLSDGVRQKTEKHVASVLDRLTKSPFAEPDRSSLDLAYYSVLKLVRDDQYLKYMDFILVQRQLRFSRMEAQWWRNEALTVREFFRFPSPVDAIESRLHAAMTILSSTTAALLSALLGFPWLWLYLTYGFLARSLCGPRVDPQAFLVLFVLRPLVTEKLGPSRNEFLPGAPMRFAQFVGLMMSSGCTVAAFFGRFDWMLGLLCVLLFFSFLWSACNTCIICVIYLACVRAKLLPASICNDCSIRYIRGEGPPMKMKAELIGDCLFMSSNSKSSMSSSVFDGVGDVIDGHSNAVGVGGGGIRTATPSLAVLKERFLGASRWKSSPGQEDGRRGGEEVKEGDTNAATGRPSTQTSRRPDRCCSARCNPPMRVVFEENTTDQDDDDDDDDDDHDDDSNNGNGNGNGISNSNNPRPKSLSARNLLSFSKDITGLADAIARPSSRKLKRTRMLADLEDYNNLFSRRLSRGGPGTGTGTGRGGHGHGHGNGNGNGNGIGSSSVGSRATSRTNPCRPASDLDVEPAADVEQPSPSEDMSVDDENDFGSGYVGGVSGDDDGDYGVSGAGGGIGDVTGDGIGDGVVYRV